MKTLKEIESIVGNLEKLKFNSFIIQEIVDYCDMVFDEQTDELINDYVPTFLGRNLLFDYSDVIFVMTSCRDEFAIKFGYELAFWATYRHIANQRELFDYCKKLDDELLNCRKWS